MRQVKHGRLSGKRIAVLILTGMMLVFIFGQSMLPQSVSAEESGWLTENVLNPLLGLLGIGPLTHHLVRKIAHVTEFVLLSVLLTLCFRGRIVKSAGVGFAAAFLDESIQLLSGRGALISDVWIDLIGVAAGSLIGWLILRILARRTKTNKSI